MRKLLPLGTAGTIMAADDLNGHDSEANALTQDIAVGEFSDFNLLITHVNSSATKLFFQADALFESAVYEDVFADRADPADVLGYDGAVGVDVTASKNIIFKVRGNCSQEIRLKMWATGADASDTIAIKGFGRSG